ncbi:MAG: polysaccharide pyruvyl transferase family protein [Velocimicrobium sp.]
MRKVLMRAVMSPIGNNKAIDVITKNLIGNNTGNMIFAASMARTVMDEDTIVDAIATNRSFTKAEIDQMNEEYDCFIIPLANAFRASFVKELEQLTALVKGLKIPCVIAGVGIQAKLDAKVEQSFSFDEAAKGFIDAVLEKSSIVGVRGEITGTYLKHLGYQEEKDYTVIGCPSMYMYGKELPKPRINGLTRNSLVSVNYKIDLPKQLHDLMERSMLELPNFHFIPQSIEELRLIYAGVPYPKKKHKVIPEKYPLTLASEIYRNDKVLGFVNVESWLEFLRGVDFSFGSRIHGNIAAVLAGTPCYIFAYDARICELADYHKIPFMQAVDIKANTNVFDVYEKTDFNMIQVGHQERFLHFIDFLNKNEIKHIYDTNGDVQNVPFAAVREKNIIEPAIHSFSSISIEEQEERLRLYHNYEERRFKNLKKGKNQMISEEKVGGWKQKIFSKIRV